MNNSTANNEHQEITITLDQNLAYEAQFVRADGKDSARCVVMGQSDPGRVSLSPGRYTLKLNPLSERDDKPFLNTIEIDRSTQHLNLSEIIYAQMDRTEKSGKRFLPRRQLKGAIRKSRLVRPLQEALSPESNKLGVFEMSQARPNEFEQETFRRRFSIGLSHNTANDKYGWLAAEDLEMEYPPFEDGALSFVVHDLALRDNAPSTKRERRVRLTLAISERPAIRTTLPLFRGGVRVTISPLLVAGTPDGIIQIEAADPRKQALVAALSRLGDEEAISVLNWSAETQGNDAIEMLLYKKRDTWAATAAALLMAKTYQLQDYCQWAYNLEKHAPHISDASVAAAWARAADQNMSLEVAEIKTLEHLMNSRKIGAPAFKVTHAIAVELLNAIRGSSNSATRRELARNEMNIWTRRARHQVFKGPYIMWEQAGKNLQKGQLPQARYKRVLGGELTKNGFEPSAFH